MQTSHHRVRKAWLLFAALSTIAVLWTACSSRTPPTPALPDVSSQQMMETLERVLEMRPQMQQQLDMIEKLNPGTSTKCASSYPERCIPPPPPRLTCQDIGLHNFLVLPPDPHHFDPDKNGIGCER